MRIAIVMALLLAGVPLLAEDAKKDEKAKVPEKDGKTKVVNTPFGPTLRAATEDKGTARRAPAHDPLLKIEESGDTVTFRRQTPFGEQVWRRKRSELTALEKEMIAARKQAQPVSQGEQQVKP